MRAGKHIEGIDPYKPGKPLEELEREYGIKDGIKLASNENPHGPSRKALTVLKKGLASLHRYPDGSGRLLREAIGKKLRVPSDRVILGNGSDEIMDLAAKTFLSAGDEAIIGDLTFSIYKICIASHHGRTVIVPLRDGYFDLKGIADRITDRTRLVFLCNPNNPTGTMIARGDLERFIKDLPPGILVVLDEAYAEYADDPDFPDSAEELRGGLPILALRTFSKMYGLAGLRIGYGLAAADVIEAMNRVRLPFNTNSLAQAAAEAALGDEVHRKRSLKTNRAGRLFLTEAFSERGLRFYPSQANFIYVDTGTDGAGIYEQLLREGVIVRLIQNGWLRVSIGRPAENRRFIRALDRVTGWKGKR
ncbi:MAG TPA: histidinol-phosphate transaminase [Nitrospiria bacterium]|nr:histidinol-phosphate transaminase [Nitrospiria bacterium]